MLQSLSKSKHFFAHNKKGDPRGAAFAVSCMPVETVETVETSRRLVSTLHRKIKTR
jgi:hypothetical protein